MKILQEKESQLIVRQSNIGNIIFGSIFIVIGIGVNIIAPIISIPIGGVFILVGVYIVLNSKTTKITLMHPSNILTIEITGFRHNQIYSLNFSEIKEIALEQYLFERTQTTGPRSKWELNLIFYLKNGESILVNAGESSKTFIMGVQLQKGLFNTKNTNVEIAKKISDFIGVPFIDRIGNTLGEAFSNLELRKNTKLT